MVLAVIILVKFNLPELINSGKQTKVPDGCMTVLTSSFKKCK